MLKFYNQYQQNNNYDAYMAAVWAYKDYRGLTLLGDANTSINNKQVKAAGNYYTDDSQNLVNLVADFYYIYGLRNYFDVGNYSSFLDKAWKTILGNISSVLYNFIGMLVLRRVLFNYIFPDTYYGKDVDLYEELFEDSSIADRSLAKEVNTAFKSGMNMGNSQYAELIAADADKIKYWFANNSKDRDKLWVNLIDLFKALPEQDYTVIDRVISYVHNKGRLLEKDLNNYAAIHKILDIKFSLGDPNELVDLEPYVSDSLKGLLGKVSGKNNDDESGWYDEVWYGKENS